MILSDDGRKLMIEGEDEVRELDQLPSTVTKVVIKNCLTVGIQLPRLPAHVKTLALSEVRTLGPVILTEGLELLVLEYIASDVPLTRWIFPASLQLVTVYHWIGEVLDLRTVTAPAVYLKSIGENDQRVILPESLNELTIDETPDEEVWNIAFPVAETEEIKRHLLEIADTNFPPTPVFHLPPYLGALNLDGFGEIVPLPESRTHEIKRVALSGNQNFVDVIGLFSHVETLCLEYWCDIINKDFRFPSLALDELRTLTLKKCVFAEPVTLDTPWLECLSILNESQGRQVTLSEEATTLGESLVTLVLQRVKAFPPAVDWNRLESVTVRKSKIELPWI